MQQLWGVHSGPVFLVLLFSESFGAFVAEIFIQNTSSPHDLYNYAIFAIHVVFGLTCGFAARPNNPKQPPAANRLTMSGALVRRQTLKEPIEMRTLRRTTTATAMTETIEIDQQSQLGEDPLPNYAHTVRSMPETCRQENTLPKQIRTLSLPQRNVIEVHPEILSSDDVATETILSETVTASTESTTPATLEPTEVFTVSETTIIEPTTAASSSSSSSTATGQQESTTPATLEPTEVFTVSETTIIKPTTAASSSPSTATGQQPTPSQQINYQVQIMSDPNNPDLPPQRIEWQNPPAYSEYIETDPSSSNATNDRGQEMRTYLSQLFQSTAESSPPVQPANPVIELRRNSDWYIKRTNFSGNSHIVPITQSERVLHTLIFSFFQLGLQTLAAIVEQQIFYRAIEFFPSTRPPHSELDSLSVITFGRLAGLVPLLLFPRSRYLLLIEFLFIAFFVSSMYSSINHQLEFEALTFTLLAVSSVGALIPTIQHQTQNTLEAAIPEWEQVMIAIGIDFGRRFFVDCISKEMKNPDGGSFAFLVLTCVLLLCTMIVRKSIIRRNAVTGTHLR